MVKLEYSWWSSERSAYRMVDTPHNLCVGSSSPSDLLMLISQYEACRKLVVFIPFLVDEVAERSRLLAIYLLHNLV